MKDVKGKIVLVTGGAMGMGRETALRFADAGSKIILVDMNEKALKKAAAEVKAKGAEVWTFIQNVTDRAGVYRLAAAVTKKIGIVDILVNCAGIVAGGTLMATDDDRIKLHFDVNLLGTIWFTKAFLTGMMKKKAGHVVNLASASGFLGVPYLAAYVSSKWGVIGFTESVRLELREEGYRNIGFTSVCPGIVTTGMFEGMGEITFTPFLTPETMGKKIFEAVIKNKIFVREPFMVKTIPLLKALTPIAFSDWMGGLLGATQSARTLKGHGLPPGLERGRGAAGSRKRK